MNINDKLAKELGLKLNVINNIIELLDNEEFMKEFRQYLCD